MTSGYAFVTFGEGDASRWIRSFGQMVDGAMPWDRHGINRTAGGRALLARCAAMAVGLYVVVDSWDRVLYIGQVRGEDPDGIRKRINRHHRLTPDWDSVWVLPLANRTPEATVRRLETAMIAAYRPSLNSQHARGVRW